MIHDYIENNLETVTLPEILVISMFERAAFWNVKQYYQHQVLSF